MAAVAAVAVVGGCSRCRGRSDVVVVLVAVHFGVVVCCKVF